MKAQKTIKSIFKEISLSLIDRPDDIVRMEIDQTELEELARSIQERGLMQPIGVTPRGDRFLIVYGDRRYLAHELIKKKTIMCSVKVIEDEQVAIDRAIENLQRVNLTPFEEGHIYLGLKEKAGLSLDEISKRFSKSHGRVRRTLDIMRMPESFQKALHNGSINMAVAEELWTCPDEGKREYFLELAIEHGITRMVAKGWVDDYKKSLRKVNVDIGGGGGELPPYIDAPLFRACDTCYSPVELKDLLDLRICPTCHDAISQAVKKDS